MGPAWPQALGQGDRVMRPQPPATLERIVGLFLPPACREEVLGDLCERYKTPGQYIGLALVTIPFVILSRIRRTTDAQVLLMEALLLYASFLIAALYTDDSILTRPWGLLRLAVPAVIALAVIVLDDAWALRDRPPEKLIPAIIIGIALGCLTARRALPPLLQIWGFLAGLILVSTVRILFRPGGDVPQAASGPAVWVETRVRSRVRKALLAGLIAGCLTALLEVAGLGGVFADLLVFLIAIWVSGLGRK
jgi:hypothetical protein